MTFYEITPLIDQLSLSEQIKVYELLHKRIYLKKEKLLANGSLVETLPNGSSEIKSDGESTKDTLADFETCLNLVLERDNEVWAALATR
ncbi:MAG: hypothetical protein KIH69_022710 [Anaerolineae bacterium]|nr:hypothetical protein [Anaerolineae bacterium]